jgi:acetyl esterase
MKLVQTTLAVQLVLLAASTALAQPKATTKGTIKLTTDTVITRDHVYKTTPQGELKLHGFFPPGWKASDSRPVVVFFFGGGWKNGAFTQFVPQAEYFATRGIVALSADYRILSKHMTTPDACVEDAKTAIRWVRANAVKLGIDPKKVIAAGGSAGGHIAACTAIVDGFNAAGDANESCVPNALMLFNPAMNVTKNTIKNANGETISEAISPTLRVTKSCPPTWLVYGTNDPAIEQGREFAAKATKLGVNVELWSAADQPHGFFNRSPWIESTTRAADRWLETQGYLRGSATLAAQDNAKLKKE